MRVATSQRPSSPQPFAGDAFTRLHWLIVVAATIVAAWLRFLDLGTWSLWIDEAHTWRDATMQLGGEGGFLRSDRVFYPVASSMLRFLFGVGWLGYDEWSLRLPFAIVGVVTVPLMALCGRRLVGAWPASLAAMLLAVDPWHLFWSQNARFYVLVVFAAVLAANRLHAWLGSERPIDLYAAALALGLGTLSHPGCALAAFGFVAFLVTRPALLDRAARRRALQVAALVMLGIVALPWLVEHYSPFGDFMRQKDDPSLLHFLETVVYYFRPTGLVLAGLGLAIAPAAIGRERALMLGAMWLVPMLALAAVGFDLVKVTARYGICAQPFVLWLAALLCVEVARRAVAVRSAAARVVLAGILPACLCADATRLDVAYFHRQHGQRARWHEAARFVQERAAGRGLRVLTTNDKSLFYYLRRRHWFVTEGDPHPDVAVEQLEDWMLREGRNAAKQQVHEPGAEPLLAWHRAEAERAGRLFAVVLTLPELLEKDTDREIARCLERDYVLALHLPCWVGPKDSSVYVYLPRT